jgi:hypothetical protein
MGSDALNEGNTEELGTFRRDIDATLAKLPQDCVLAARDPFERGQIANRLCHSCRVLRIPDRKDADLTEARTLLPDLRFATKLRLFEDVVSAINIFVLAVMRAANKTSITKTRSRAVAEKVKQHVLPFVDAVTVEQDLDDDDVLSLVMDTQVCSAPCICLYSRSLNSFAGPCASVVLLFF